MKFILNILMEIFYTYKFKFHNQKIFNSNLDKKDSFIIVETNRIYGSHIADLIFQIIGLSGFFLSVILLKIGIKISSRGSKKNIIIKLILLPIFILFLSSEIL